MPEATEREPLLVLTDAGGGHRAAARALAAAAGEGGSTLRLTPVRIQDVLASLDLLRRLSGSSIEDAYNAMLRRHWTALFPPLLGVLHLALRVRHRGLVRDMARHLAARERPAAVVSLMPNLNAVMRDAVRAALPGVPFLVVLTDFADYPPHFWLEPGYDAVVVGSDAAVAQARAIGFDDTRIRRVSGMLLHPRFSPARRPGGTRARARGARAAGRRLRAAAALRRQELERDAAAHRGAARAFYEETCVCDMADIGPDQLLRIS